MTNILRWGVLGLGKISQKSMLPAFRFSSFAECRALGSQDLIKAKRLSEDLPNHPLALDYNDLVHCSEIDAVYIALPNQLHAHWTIQALKAGKYVLCEKPLALSLAEYESIMLVAQQSGCLFAEAFMYRHHPQHATVKSLIQNGDIGILRHFQARFTYLLEDLKNIRSRPECGGGAWYDVGCYGIDAARYILGSEPLAWNLLSSVGQQSQVDENTCCQMRFPNGVLAQIYCGTNSYREHYYEVLGSKGKIEVHEAFIPAGGKVSNILLKNEAGQKVFKHLGVNQYALELDHFAQCVENGQLLYPMEDGLANGKILHHQNPYAML